MKPAEKTPLSKPSPLIALLHGPDRKGIVAEVATWITAQGSNILEADQHCDTASGTFFQRLVWEVESGVDAARQGMDFKHFAESKLNMSTSVKQASDRTKVVVMVSQTDHCLHELCLRFQSGDLPGELAGVIGNHPSLSSVAHRYGLNFHCVPVTSESKAAAESKQLEIIREYGAGLVVLARYMQILSDSLLKTLGCPVINIHHSFLPAFAGGRPYHQAFERGVKLIGATAHYATPDLDEGPIIHQDVTRINHRFQPADLIRSGRDLEKLVLATAVRRHLEHRVLVFGNKTVVFD